MVYISYQEIDTIDYGVPAVTVELSAKEFALFLYLLNAIGYPWYWSDWTEYQDEIEKMLAEVQAKIEAEL